MQNELYVQTLLFSLSFLYYFNNLTCMYYIYSLQHEMLFDISFMQ